MGCCGKTIEKVKNIAVGHTSLAVENATGIEALKYKHTDDRIRACWTCTYQTWMSRTEYTAWLVKHGIEVLTNFTQLEELPMLPKYKQSNKRRNLYCRICKCFIPAKARVKEMNCPKNVWEDKGV